ncbi:MAG: ATP-binding protein [Clostridia bacterium]|nr:ATP-binding protein [Clostridia bacterium]
MSMDANNMQEKTLSALAHAKLFLHKEYLQCMSRAKLVGIAAPADSAENLRLIHVDTLLYDQQERVSEKLKSLFGAVENYGESIVLLINGKKDRAEIYMGVACEQAPQPVFDTFLRSMNSLLPGCQYRILHNAAIRSLMDELLPPAESIHVSAVAAFPMEEKRQDEQLQKLDVLIEGMKHSPFSMVLLAQSILPEELSAMRQQLQRLYTELSSLEKSTLTLSQSNSKSIGESISRAITETIGHNASISRGHSTTRGAAVSQQQELDQDRARHNSGLYLAGTAAAVLLAGPEANVLQSLFYSSSLTKVISSGEQILGMKAQDHQAAASVSTHEDESSNESMQLGYNQSRAENTQQGANTNYSNTYGETQQATQVNKAIADILSMLDAQLKQIATFQREGAFHTAAYFIAGDSETAVSAANQYRSICTSGALATLHSPICEWNQTSDVAIIRHYLASGRHPVFRFPNNDVFPEVRLAQLIGLSDMPRYFALPERTIPGMVASTAARFARDVVSRSAAQVKKNARSIRIGSIYHMGKVDTRTTVNLNLDDLTKHLFVSGATGVGKSNFCYQLLDELDRHGIKMLIIEPAKGEYRHVLGGREGFSVYGVDPARGPVLRINPFACPDEIPTIQHIERLLDIFNTAWPMYSAMPAILKEAVELIYTEKGFNLMGGGRPEGAQFPSFSDLLEALPRVINQSSYSNEVKGNYIGALVTRVKSLTNGLYGLIFSQDEIGDENLFSSNVIADISRIGSAETKALLMGVLTTRLIEYRMAEGRMNSPLRHVTVLEEAHNLLRRHNPSSEGSSARAASVEMLASAIAEMRSSGEGFIIADQSPSVMDWSVIRNTQTKVFFMLPDREDRLIAGNSLSLNDAQQQEIAKLRTGVAAVYQNGWADAVLCKIDYFDKSRERPFVFTPVNMKIDHRGLLGQAAAALIMHRMSGRESSLDAQKIEAFKQYDSAFLNTQEREARRILTGWTEDAASVLTGDEEYSALCRILDLEQILKGGAQAKSISQWADDVHRSISHRAVLTGDEIRTLVSFGLHRWGRREASAKGLYIRYLEYISSKA